MIPQLNVVPRCHQTMFLQYLQIIFKARLFIFCDELPLRGLIINVTAILMPLSGVTGLIQSSALLCAERCWQAWEHFIKRKQISEESYLKGFIHS